MPETSKCLPLFQNLAPWTARPSQPRVVHAQKYTSAGASQQNTGPLDLRSFERRIFNACMYQIWAWKGFARRSCQRIYGWKQIKTPGASPPTLVKLINMKVCWQETRICPRVALVPMNHWPKLGSVQQLWSNRRMPRLEQTFERDPCTRRAPSS